MSPEESIKFKATEDVIPTEESAEEVILEREKIMMVHLRKMALKKILSPINVVNLLILALQMKCRSRKSSTTSTHQVLSL